MPRLETTWNNSGILYFLVSEEGFSRLGLRERIFGVGLHVDQAREPVIKNTLNQMVYQYNKSFDQNTGQPWYVVQNAKTVALNVKSDQIDSQRDYIFFGRIVIGGICAMLLFFGIANYVHVTVTAAAVRRKELAVLESIGMTAGQIRKMLILEGLHFCLITTGLVITLGSGAWYAFGRIMKERIAYFLFRYPCEELLLCFGVLCLLCVLIPLVVWKKYGREPVVDRLRQFTD